MCVAVKDFMLQDDNSMKSPDKVKIDIRYRLDFVCILHEKFLAETDLDISLSHFSRLIPKNIIKPEPTDWGTSLCMTCLNPQLKLEGLKRSFKYVYKGVSIEDILSYTSIEMQALKTDIASKQGSISYLQWTKIKSKREKVAAKDKKTTKIEKK